MDKIQVKTDGFRPMRRIRQQLPDEEVAQILERGTYGVLSVLGENGYPYGVPVNYVFHGGKIYFHSALNGHKVDAMKAHDKVSFTVVDKDTVVKDEYTTYFRSVIAFGRVRFLEDEAEKMAALTWLGERFNPGDKEGLGKEIAKGFTHLHMVEITVDHLTGKESIELVRSRSHPAGAGCPCTVSTQRLTPSHTTQRPSPGRKARQETTLCEPFRN